MLRRLNRGNYGEHHQRSMGRDGGPSRKLLPEDIHRAGFDRCERWAGNLGARNLVRISKRQTGAGSGYPMADPLRPVKRGQRTTVVQ